MDGRGASVGRRGVHANIDDLTSGAIAGIRVPSGGQVSLWTSTTASSAQIQATRSTTETRFCPMIIS